MCTFANMKPKIADVAARGMSACASRQALASRGWPKRPRPTRSSSDRPAEVATVTSTRRPPRLGDAGRPSRSARPGASPTSCYAERRTAPESLFCRDLPHDIDPQANLKSDETTGMDAADLFSPADTAALLAIRAVIANRKVTLAELEALFASTGLITHRNATDLGVDVLRGFLRSPAPAGR